MEVYHTSRGVKNLGIHLEILPTLPSCRILREVTSAIRTTEAEVALIRRHVVTHRNHIE